MVSENNQALFVLSTHPHPHPGSGRAEPEWAEEWPGGSGNMGVGVQPGAGGSREFCVTAGLTMWALFPPRAASVPLRVADREQSWEHLPGPWEKACVLPS